MLIAEGYVDDQYGPMGPILNVSGDARRELGTWPSVDNVALDMAAAFEQAAQSEAGFGTEEGAAFGSRDRSERRSPAFQKYLENKAGL